MPHKDFLIILHLRIALLISIFCFVLSVFVSPSGVAGQTPTDTPIPLPTDTPVPLPTDTPVPLPTNTPVPLPTNTPAVLPTDTPVPLPTNTTVPLPTNTPAPTPLPAISVTWNTWQATITNNTATQETIWIWIDCYNSYQPSCPVQYTGRNGIYSITLNPGETSIQGPSRPFCFEGQMDIGTRQNRPDDIGSQIFTTTGTPDSGGVNGWCSGPCAPPAPSFNRGLVTATINPIEDAHVDIDNPTVNYGTNPTLEVNGIPRKYAYMRFDLSQFRNTRVVAADLRLMNETAHTARVRVQDIIQTNPPWSEIAVTYNTAPESSQTYSFRDDGTINTWSVFDVLSGVTRQNGGVKTFRIMTFDLEDVRYSSRESCTGAPQLIVTYDPGSFYVPPAPTPTPREFQPSSCSQSAADIMIVMDASGSMYDSLDQAKSAAAGFVDIMAQNSSNRVGFIIFTSPKTSYVLSTLTSNFSAVRSAILGFTQPSGGSCLECGAYLANQEFKANPRTNVQKAVIFLTDGKANKGMNNEKQTQPVAQRLTYEEVARGYAANNATYYPIGYGNGAETAFMQSLAQLTGGSYYAAPTTTELTAIYDQIAVAIGIGNGSISGVVYQENNANRKLDPADGRLSGWPVNIIGSGISGVRTVTSEDDGSYTFGGLCNGDFRIYTSQQNNFIQVNPGWPYYYEERLTTGNSLIDRDFGNIQGYTVEGNVFNDANKNAVKDAGEENYDGNITITSSAGTVTTTNNGTYKIDGLPGGLYTVSFSSLPRGYITVYPRNGPPPTFSFVVGPGCNLDRTTGGSCDSGNNIVDLNFAITNSIPWVQGIGMDLRFDNGYDNYVPPAPACGVGPYGAATGPSSTSPGIIFTGDTQPNFGAGQSSSENWVVGGTAYPDTYTTSKRELATAYNTLLASIQKGGETITNIQSLQGCDVLSNCSLPNNLPESVLQANGDLTLNGYSFPPNKNYVILVDGTLTINGFLTVPRGSSVIYSAKRNIVINRSVGVAPVCNPGNNSIQGIFSADADFIVQGYNDCAFAGPDNMLRIEGTVIVNAGLVGGKFDNKRDLCADDPLYPVITFEGRPDFILNAPDIVRQKSFIYQEVAP